jgi:long-chain acyl-CoA synthetase
MREASALLEAGHTVLIFPEGTRTSTGEMAPFRPAVSYLALKHGLDILPVHVEGTFRSMPRGAFVPKNRNIGVRIGEPISAAKLKAAMDGEGLRPSAASQKATQVVQMAVECLRDGRRFDLQRALDAVLGKHVPARPGAQSNGHALYGESETARTLREIFTDLEKRFQPDAVKDPLTYYFSLGEGKETKWTVQVNKDGCRIINDKVDGKADCVFKTDAKTFTEIIRDHRIPDVSEFLNGTIKTNDPDLLTTFLQVFNI